MVDKEWGMLGSPLRGKAPLEQISLPLERIVRKENVALK
jgi:hypothetical protein